MSKPTIEAIKWRIVAELRDASDEQKFVDELELLIRAVVKEMLSGQKPEPNNDPVDTIMGEF